VLARPADGDLADVGRQLLRLVDPRDVMDPRRTGVEHASAVLPRARAELHGLVGAGDDGRVVLDDDDRVPGIAQTPEDGQQPLAVAGVEADRRLVDDVHRLGQRAAERRGEIDAL
jgi:hypothetical protein